MKKLIPLFYVVVVVVLVGSGCKSKSAGDTWTRDADDMVMVYVPKAEFQMGSTDGSEDERPVHTVALEGFWIDRTEVTNAQYQLCVEAGGCEAPSRLNLEFKDEDKTDHPKVNVDWYDAEAYCEWAGSRLPTEAEWEYAARGPEGFKYPWGDSEPDESMLNYVDIPGQDENAGDTTAVGSYPDGASWCGTLDMAGNVWEWCADWFADDYYATSPSRNPTGPTSGTGRVMRGGSWFEPIGVRGADRDGVNPANSDFDYGFRCARSLQ